MRYNRIFMMRYLFLEIIFKIRTKLQGTLYVMQVNHKLWK